MVTHAHKAQVELPNDTTVEVTRSFNAPRELVYEAYTTPELMKRWLVGAPGWTMPVCEMDLRPGGTFRWGWKSDEGDSHFGFHGTFREVEPPTRLVHTETYDPGSMGGSMGGEALITLTFTESGGVTTLAMTIAYDSKESRDMALSTGMTDGMELSYQQLDALLAERG